MQEMQNRHSSWLGMQSASRRCLRGTCAVGRRHLLRAMEKTRSRHATHHSRRMGVLSIQIVAMGTAQAEEAVEDGLVWSQRGQAFDISLAERLKSEQQMAAAAGKK